MSLGCKTQHEQKCARQNNYAPESPCKSTLCFCWAIKDANNKGPPHALCYLQIVLGVASVCIPTSSIGVHPILQHQCASQYQKCPIDQSLLPQATFAAESDQSATSSQRHTLIREHGSRCTELACMTVSLSSCKRHNLPKCLQEA